MSRFKKFSTHRKKESLEIDFCKGRIYPTFFATHQTSANPPYFRRMMVTLYSLLP